MNIKLTRVKESEDKGAKREAKVKELSVRIAKLDESSLKRTIGKAFRGPTPFNIALGEWGSAIVCC